MPFTLIVVVAGPVVGWLAGGRVRALADADLAAPGLLFVGLLLQVAVDAAAGRGWIGGATSYVLLLVSQVLVLAWIVFNWPRRRSGDNWPRRRSGDNRPRGDARRGGPLRTFSLAALLVGLLANAAVIAANGAMPVDPAAIGAVLPPADPTASIGYTLRGEHELLTSSTRLPLLADRIALRPIRTVISIGDIAIALGAAALVVDLMRSRPARDDGVQPA